jgi:tRNA threonylcarbamoyladenosine biosynthesis protein TsaE
MEINYHLDNINLVAEVVIDHLTSKTILLYGDMGVGKTTLIKAIVNALGSNDIGNSPTFAIVNEYKTAQDTIYHFDLYRIKDEEEALNFGMDDYLSSNSWLFIEWPDKILNLLPNDINSLEIVLNEDNSRTLKLNQNINLTNKTAMADSKF